MVSSDTIVGIVGAVILTGAMIAVFYYEADRDATGAPGDIGMGSEVFQARWVEHDDHPSVDEEDISLSEGASWTKELPTPPYTYEVHVEVDWDEHDLDGTPLMGDFSYTIEVLDQDADDAEVASTPESPLHHTVNDTKSTPSRMEFTVAANSTEDAEMFLEEYLESDEVQATQRNWTIRVTLDDDGLVADDPTGEENVVRTFDVKVRFGHYVPELVTDEE